MPSFTRDRKCFECVGRLENTVLFCSMRGEAAGTQDIIVKLTKPNNVSACLQRCFFVSNVPDPGLLRSVLCADNSTKAQEPYAKNSGREVDIRGGERSYLVTGRT